MYLFIYLINKMFCSAKEIQNSAHKLLNYKFNIFTRDKVWHEHLIYNQPSVTMFFIFIIIIIILIFDGNHDGSY